MYIFLLVTTLYLYDLNIIIESWCMPKVQHPIQSSTQQQNHISLLQSPVCVKQSTSNFSTINFIIIRRDQNVSNLCVLICMHLFEVKSLFTECVSITCPEMQLIY